MLTSFQTGLFVTWRDRLTRSTLGFRSIAGTRSPPSLLRVSGTGVEGHSVILPLPLKRSRSVHEFVKLAELDAAEEGVPFVRGITEHRPIGALAVADADDVAG